MLEQDTVEEVRLRVWNGRGQRDFSGTDSPTADIPPGFRLLLRLQAPAEQADGDGAGIEVYTGNRDAIRASPAQ